MLEDKDSSNLIHMRIKKHPAINKTKACILAGLGIPGESLVSLCIYSPTLKFPAGKEKER